MYTVVFTRRARDDLARHWLNADSETCAAITVAAREVEVTLRRNPSNRGESRSGNIRIAFEAPLGFLFDIRDADKQVHVLHIWQYGRTDA